MRNVPIIACIGLLATICADAPAAAQPKAATPAARREQFAKDQEAIGDPDPMMRVANMEAIIASNDGLRIDFAIRAAFASDDSQMKGLAMRAYFATHKQMTFDIALPPSVQAQYDSGSPSTIDELKRHYQYLATVSDIAFRVQFMLPEYTLGQNTGTISSYPDGSSPANFTITGTRLTALVHMKGIANDCYVDIRPGPTQTLAGTLACPNGWPKLAMSTPAF